MQHHAAGFGLVPGSPEFWRNPERIVASTDPNTAAGQAIGVMCRDVKRSVMYDAVRQAAEEAARQFWPMTGCRSTDPDSLARALSACAFWWVKSYVKYVHHEFLIRRHLGEADHYQGLIAPEVLVSLPNPEGDCAIMSSCVAAFLDVYGIPYEFVTVAANPAEPGTYSHVYVYAVLPDGSRLPLDAIPPGEYPGWEVPAGRVSKLQVWNSDGSPVADRGTHFAGMSGYGLRGMGDTSGDYGGEYTGPDLTTPISTTSPVDPYLQSGGVSYDLGPGYFGSNPDGTYTAPAQSSNQWAAFAAQALKSGVTLAELQTMQPGTVINPNGQIVRQAPGFAVTAGNYITSASAAVGGTGNLMLLVLAGAVVFLMVGSKK